MSDMLQKELLDLPKGTRVKPKEAFKHIENYVWRADECSSLRKRLARLSELGKFRMVELDEWERT
jgi:hypothetical protein